MRISVAGCGRMGQPMLAALIKGGFGAQGFDVRAPETYGAFANHMTNSPINLSPKTEVLISVVRDVAQTEALLFDDQALLNQLKSLKYLIISSTLSPRYIDELKNRVGPITLIDAPMSGAAIAAKEARLSFMLGGEATDIAKLMPMFQSMGQYFHHMGPTGAGMTGKVLNNLIAAGSVALTRTALDWAANAGLSQEKLLALIHTSSGQNWFASGFDSIEFARDGFAPDNSIGLLQKDVEAAIDAAPIDADTGLAQALLQQVAAMKPKR